jgi:hypothetical protein
MTGLLMRGASVGETDFDGVVRYTGPRRHSSAVLEKGPKSAAEPNRAVYQAS